MDLSELGLKKIFEGDSEVRSGILMEFLVFK
jgi:hypothetical protein